MILESIVVCIPSTEEVNCFLRGVDAAEANKPAQFGFLDSTIAANRNRFLDPGGQRLLEQSARLLLNGILIVRHDWSYNQTRARRSLLPNG